MPMSWSGRSTSCGSAGSCASSGDGYDFSHDLLRETAYAQVSPPKRWLLHRRLAQSLELLHADDTDQVAAQLAEQYARGGRPARAVAYYRRAAERGRQHVRLRRGDPAAQGGAVDRPRRCPTAGTRTRQELAVLEAMAAPLNARYGYSSPELQQTLERSIALAESLGRTDSTLTGLVALWTSRFVQGRTADALRDGHPRALAAGSTPGSDAERPGALRRRRVGPEPRAGRPRRLRHLELAAS